MRSKSTAWETTVDLLSRRDHSMADLRRKLERKGFSPEEIESALERGQQCGYIDDRRFARQKAQALQSSGRAVGRRLQLELRRAGVTDADSAMALEEVQDKAEDVKVLQQLLERRYPTFRYDTADARLKKRVFDYFLRRGFTRDQIFQALQHEDA